MSSISQGAEAETHETVSPGISPVAALIEAFSHVVAFLFNPFELRHWLKLGAVCLFLGGGASWAAIHWSLGALPSESGLDRAIFQVRLYLARHPLAGLGAAAIGVALGVVLIYLRALCRFTLVASILRGEVHLHQAWAELRSVAETYFRWLLAALFLMGLALAAGMLIALPLLRDADARPAFASALLAGLLIAEVLMSVTLGLAITLTDDLVTPIIYAEQVTLPAAWRRLVTTMRSDVGAFVLYILLRFVVSVAAGIAVLFFLFPALVALFSGSVIVAALVVLGLEQVGIGWDWTPVTTLIAGVALLLLVGLLFAVMGVVSMPGQVFLQTFGMRFIAPRVPALHARLNPHASKSRNE